MDEQAFLEKTDPKHAALIVVDVQNDFCHSQGALGQAGNDMTLIQETVPRIVRLIDEARLVGVPIIYTFNIYNDWLVSPALLERRKRRGPNFKGTTLEGTWGAEFYGGIKPFPNEAIVYKSRPSAFIDTNFDLMLRSKGIKTLIMTGIATNVCVESTARDGSMKDYWVILVEDCCASQHPHLHQSTLENISLFFGDVVKAEDLVRAWASPRELVRRQ